MKFLYNQFLMMLKSLLSAFFTLSIVLRIEYKVLSSAYLLKNVPSGYENKSFKKILKSRGPKMGPWGTPATFSDHELYLLMTFVP